MKNQIKNTYSKITDDKLCSTPTDSPRRVICPPPGRRGRALGGRGREDERVSVTVFRKPDTGIDLPARPETRTGHAKPVIARLGYQL